MYISTHIYMHLYIWMYLHTYICIHMDIYTYIYSYECIFIYICVDTYIYTHTYICAYRLYIYIYIYMCIQHSLWLHAPCIPYVASGPAWNGLQPNWRIVGGIVPQFDSSDDPFPVHSYCYIALSPKKRGYGGRT